MHQHRTADQPAGAAVLGVHRPVEMEGGPVVGADRRDRLRREGAQIALDGRRRDRAGPRGPGVEDVAQEVLGAGADQPLRERRWLGQQEPGVVLERSLGRHPLELVHGRQDVEHRQSLDRVRMVERHPVGDPSAPIVAHHREALEAEPRHQLDQL
jgi:hypothetical protein